MLARKALAGTAAAPKIYVEDVFSTYLYTGNGTGNFIENGINLGNANSSGSAYLDSTGDYVTVSANTVLQLGSGDFTVEFWHFRNSVSSSVLQLSAGTDDYSPLFGYPSGTTLQLYLSSNNSSWDIASGISMGTLPAGEWAHFAVTRSGSTFRTFKNGTLVSTFTSSSSLYQKENQASIGKTQGGTASFNGYISNLRIVKGTAVYTSAFTPSTSELSAISGTSLLVFQGNNPFVDNSGNALSVTAYGDSKAKSFGPFTGSTAGEGGMVWTKNRDTAGTNHILCDTGRGITNYINSNNANGQNANGSLTDVLTAVTNSGYLIGADATLSAVNVNAKTYTSWTFRKAKKFFDIVTFTTNGSEPPNTGDISHNLGSTPGCVMVKCTSGSQDWKVYHTGLSGGGFNAINRVLQLNDTSAASTSTNWINVSSTTISFPGSALDPSSDYVAYLFAHDAGGFGDAGSDSIIKCDTFTTNGSGAATVTLNWEPQWVMFKRTDSSTNGDWEMFDNMRGLPATGTGSIAARLRANLSSAENASTGDIKITSTGFVIDTVASATYIYIAIRRGPMKTPTSGTSVFTPKTRTGTGSATTVTGISANVVDAVFTEPRVNGSGDQRTVWDRMRGASNYLVTTGTGAEANYTSGLSGFDVMNGYKYGSGDTLVNSAQTYVDFVFTRAPGFFDVVCWTTPGSGDSVVSHNLGVTPELMIVKSRGAVGPWYTYNKDLTTPLNYYLRLNTNNAQANAGGAIWAVSSSSITVDETLLSAGYGAVAYLFASVSGVSKVGSYTGNGSSVTVTTDFQPRFILVKRTDSTGDWLVSDSARGLVAGNDPYLELNTTDAEVTNEDWVDISSTSFTVNQTTNNANVNNGTYIYLCIA